MKTIQASETLKVPDNVTVQLKARLLKVTGPRGVLSRNFRKQNLDIQLLEGGKTILVQSWFATRKQLACIRTTCSHIENMFTGVLKGYRYNMRLVYAHFPINIAIPNDGKTVEVRNFLGEKVTRVVNMLDGVTITRGDGTVKDELVLEGNDLELVSQSAAKIHLCTKVKEKDIRKFLDGIYVSQKGAMEETRLRGGEHDGIQQKTKKKKWS
jgi:large subunit ribosomal protein L9e